MKMLATTATIAVMAFAGLGCGSSDHWTGYRGNGGTYHEPARQVQVPPPPAQHGYFHDYYRGGFEQRNIEREGWVLLGSRTVDFKKDGDTIMVDRGERYGQLRLVVTGAPIEMYKMNVYFRNGDKFPVETRHIFREDTQTRAIDLPGGGRDIRKVTFLYRTLDRYQGKATVYLFGR